MADETNPAPKTKSYPVLGRIRHNGKLYEPGTENAAIDAADIAPKEAKPLIDAGILGKLA